MHSIKAMPMIVVFMRLPNDPDRAGDPDQTREERRSGERRFRTAIYPANNVRRKCRVFMSARRHYCGMFSELPRLAVPIPEHGPAGGAEQSRGVVQIVLV